MVSEWVKVRKEGADLRGLPMLSFRKQGIALNAEFVKSVGDKPYCSIMFDKEGSRLGLLMKDENADRDDYTVSKDGGRREKKTHSRLVACSALMSGNPLLKRMANENVKLPLEKEVRGDVWFVRLRPMFELRAETASGVPSGVWGIYRLVEDEDIVYIGQGNIRARVRQHEKSEYTFERVEYSELLDEDDRFKWERFYIEKFKSDFGRLPMFNRISGRESSSPKL